MLSYSFGLTVEAAAVEAAMQKVLNEGPLTGDLHPEGGAATTEQVGQAVCAAIG